MNIFEIEKKLSKRACDLFNCHLPLNLTNEQDEYQITYICLNADNYFIFPLHKKRSFLSEANLYILTISNYLNHSKTLTKF